MLLDPPGFVEEEDYVELDGMRIDKPFVEKPVSGEDHNVRLAVSLGGGVWLGEMGDLWHALLCTHVERIKMVWLHVRWAFSMGPLLRRG